MAFAMVQSSWTKVRDFIPRSRYTTSMEGLTWRQAFTMPLPPYLSPIPVIFRMMAYAVITPVIVLIVLDIGGYLVWRLYSQPIWSTSIRGTRTAFYKFRTSPVFTRSRTGSPIIAKETATLAPSPPYSPGTRETSISPISSSASLHDEERSNSTSDDDEYRHDQQASHSAFLPPDFPLDGRGFSSSSTTTALSRGQDANNNNNNNLDTSFRKRARHRSSSSNNKRFSVGSMDDEDVDREEREHTPTLASPDHHMHHQRQDSGARSNTNSLGLGFDNAYAGASSISTSSGPNVSTLSPPQMYIATSANKIEDTALAGISASNSASTSGDDLVQIGASPAGSSGSLSNLDEDENDFKEAKSNV